MIMNYALIDAASRPDIAHIIRSHALRKHARALFERQPEARHASLGPWLLHVEAQPSLRGVLQTLEHVPGAVTLLAADVEMDALFLHLESRLDLRLADGSLAMLRFWDGRAIHRLWQVLTDSQRHALMGPVSHWSFRINGRAVEMRRPTLEATDA